LYRYNSVVSFAPTPTTRQAPLLLAAPVGMPVTLSGSHYLPDPSFGCSFGGGAARAMMGSFVSSALFKCEVPGGGNAGPESWWGAAVLPVSHQGAAEASMATAVAAARGRNVAELSRPVPWVGALSATPAQTDSGGGAVLAVPITDLDYSEASERVWWMGNLTAGVAGGGSGAGGGGLSGGGSSGGAAAAKESARAAADDPRSATARTMGCLIGTVRVAATRSQGGGSGVECLAPAHRPGAGTLVRVAVGAPRAEASVGVAAVVHYASAGSRVWSSSTFEAPTVFIGAGRARPLSIGAPPPPPAALLKLLRGPTESGGEMGAAIRAPPPPLECYAGAGGRVAEARRIHGRPNEVECWPPAPGGGDARGAGFVPIALVWAEGLGDRHVWGGHGTALQSSPVAIDARRETEVNSAIPHSVASGAAANRPLRLRGVDLPAEVTTMAPVCVYGGGGGTASFESQAIVVSTALIICGPVDGQALDAVASDGGGAALAVEAGWAGAGSSATSQSGLLLRVESVSALAVEAAAAIPVEPSVAPASGGAVVVFPVAAGGGTLTSSASIEDVASTSGGTPSGGGVPGAGISEGITCSFGTISGVAARRSGSTATKMVSVECMAPAHVRGSVPATVSLPSGATHHCGESTETRGKSPARPGGACMHTFTYSAALPWRTRYVSWVEKGEGVEATADKKGRAAALRSISAPASALAGGNLPVTMYIDAEASAAAVGVGGGAGGAAAADGLAPLWCHVTIAGGSASVAGSDVAASPAVIVSGAMVKCEPPMLPTTSRSQGGPASAWLAPPTAAESSKGPAGPVGFRWELGGIQILGVSPPASSVAGGTIVTVMATNLESAAAADRGGAGVLGCVFGTVGAVAGRAVRGSSAVECVTPAARLGPAAVALEAGLSRWRGGGAAWLDGLDGNIGLGIASLWYRPDANVDAVMPSAAPADGGGVVAMTLSGLSLPLVNAHTPVSMLTGQPRSPPCLLGHRQGTRSAFHRGANVGVVDCRLAMAPAGWTAVSLDPAAVASAVVGASAGPAGAVILFAPTHVRSVSPSLVPVEGDAVLWVAGQNLRFDQVVGAATEARCVFSSTGGVGGPASAVEAAQNAAGSGSGGGGGYGANGEAGFALAVSSAVAICVTPPGGEGASRGDRATGGGSELSFPGPGAAHLPVGALSGDSAASSSTVLVRWQHLGLPKVSRVYPGISREGGGAPVDVTVAGVAAGVAEDAASACLFGTLGPIAGRRNTAGSGANGERVEGVSVQCITPAAKAGARPVALVNGLMAPQRGPYTVQMYDKPDVLAGPLFASATFAAAAQQQFFHAPAAVIHAALPSLVPSDSGNPAVSLVGYGLEPEKGAPAPSCVLDGNTLPLVARGKSNVMLLDEASSGHAVCTVPSKMNLGGGGGMMGFGGFGDWSALTVDTAAETGGGGMILRRRTPIAYAAAPQHIPAGGGAVIVVSGTRLAMEGAPSCVFILGDDPSGSVDRAASPVQVISSALGRCESPDVTGDRDKPSASAAGGGALISIGWSSAGATSFPDENAANVRLMAAYPAQASAVTPSVIPAAGGALLAVVLAAPASDAAAGAGGATGAGAIPLQCRVAAIGPVASRAGGSAAAAMGVLECIAPAYVPARRAVALEVGPARGGWHVWRSEGSARPDAKLLVLPVVGGCTR
jgi:hypothetical protein